MWVNGLNTEQSGVFIILFGTADPYQLHMEHGQMPRHWQRLLPAHRWLPTSLLLAHFQDTAVSFSLPLGPGEGEQPGRQWQTWSTSRRPRIPEHSEVTGFFPADPSLLPRTHFKRNKRRVLWGVKSGLFFARERTFFSNNYCIIINTQERHDVKNEITENIFGPQHLALYKLTDNPIRHSDYGLTKLENCCHYIVIINTL